MIVFQYANAIYVKSFTGNEITGIFVDINGVPWTVPICPGNTDYDNMMLLVSEGKLVIAPAEALS
jgi:hypothetical protein